MESPEPSPGSHFRILLGQDAHWHFPGLSVRKTEDGQLAAQCGVIGQSRIAADDAEAGRVDSLFLGALCAALVSRRMPGLGVLRRQETARQAYAGPAADTRVHGNVLLALVLVGGDVADDAGRRLELVKLLAVLIDRLQVAFQRAVEDDIAGSGERSRPDRELLRLRPDDLALCSIPGNEVAHA